MSFYTDCGCLIPDGSTDPFAGDSCCTKLDAAEAKLAELRSAVLELKPEVDDVMADLEAKVTAKHERLVGEPQRDMGKAWAEIERLRAELAQAYQDMTDDVICVELQAQSDRLRAELDVAHRLVAKRDGYINSLEELIQANRREYFSDLSRAEAKLARVREMHREDRDGYCELCACEEHPCPTRRAIEGEQT